MAARALGSSQALRGADIPRENLSPLPANSVFRASTNFSRIFSFCRREGSKLRLRGLLCARPCAGHTIWVSSPNHPGGYHDPHFTDGKLGLRGGSTCSKLPSLWQSKGLSPEGL